VKSRFSELKVSDVRRLLEQVNLHSYVDIFEDNGIDGPTLMNCKSVDDVIELGIPIRAKARKLFNLITELKELAMMTEVRLIQIYFN